MKCSAGGSRQIWENNMTYVDDEEEDEKDDTDLPYTVEEKNKLLKLHRAMDIKFDEIASAVATNLGYSHQPEFVSEEDREKIIDKADDAIERWQKDAEIGSVEPTTPLQHLLQQLCDIEAQISNIREEALVRGGFRSGNE